MMTKKSTPNPFANVCNVVLMLNRDELRANGMIVVQGTTPFVERTVADRIEALRLAAMKRATSGDRRRYYEAS
jgi:hypothetical protein